MTLSQTKSKSCLVHIEDVQFIRATSQRSSCTATWKCYVDGEVLGEWKEEYGPGAKSVHRKDIGRNVLMNFEPGHDIVITFRKLKQKRLLGLGKQEEMVIPCSDVLRKIEEGTSNGVADSDDEQNKGKLHVYETKTGRIEIKLRFSVASNEQLYTDAVTSHNAAMIVSDGKVSVLDSMGKIGQALEILVKVGLGIAELSEYSKMSMALFNVVFQQIKHEDTDHVLLQSLISSMASMLTFVQHPEFQAAVYVAKHTVREMLVLIERAFIFIKNHFKRGGFVRVFNSALGSTSEKIQELNREFGKIKEQLDRDMSLQVVASTYRLEVQALLADLIPVDVRCSGYDESLRCMKHTRTTILEEIVEWSSSLTSPTSPGLMWLRGQAGTGKTCIATSFFDALVASGRPSVSLFCKFGDDRLGTSRFVVPLLARQLAVVFPPYMQALSTSLPSSAAVAVTSQGINEQYSILFKIPLQAAVMQKRHHVQPVILMVDALDECGDEDSRRGLILALIQISVMVPWLKVFLTSRPQPDLTRALDNQLTRDLQEDAQRQNTVNDIRIFMVARFKEIVVKRHMPSVWPEERHVDKLTHMAGDLFIWAKTAVDFIGGGMSPQARLDTLLSMQAAPHSNPLDDLYARVLQEHFGDADNSEGFRMVMGIVLTAAIPLRMSTLEILVGEAIPQSLFKTILGYLGALVHADPVSAYHASFPQYLTSERCPKQFFIDVREYAPLLLDATLRHMKTTLHFNMYGVKSSYSINSQISDAQRALVSAETEYSCQYWLDHVSQLDHGAGLPSTAVKLLRALFTDMQLLYWLEVVCVSRALSEVIRTLEFVDELKDPVLSSHFYNLWRFMKSFGPPILHSVAHIYISAIPFSPQSSSIYEKFMPRLKNSIRLTKGAETSWTPALNVLEGHSDLVQSVVFHPDGHQVVSGSKDGTVRVWDAEAGEQLMELTGHTDGVTCVIISPDGEIIASASTDTTIRLWSSESGQPYYGSSVLEGHSASVEAVVFARDSQHLVSASKDNTVRVWNVGSGQLLYPPLCGHVSGVRSVAISHDGRTIISGSVDGVLKLWDFKTGEFERDVVGHSGVINSVMFSPQGDLIMSGSEDHTIRFWTGSGYPIGNPIVCDDPVTSLYFSADGDSFLVGTKTQTHSIRAWNLVSKKPVGPSLIGHIAWILSVAYSNNGHKIASGSEDKSIRIWDGWGSVVGRFQRGITDLSSSESEPSAHLAWVNCVAFSPDGKVIASATGDREICIRDARSGQLLNTLVGHTGRAQTVAFSADGTMLVSASEDLTLRLYIVLEAYHCQHVMSGHSAWITSVAFGPDSSMVVSGADDCTIRLWKTSNGECVGAPFTGHQDAINAVAVSSDGARCASGSNDRTVRIWDFEGRCLHILQGHTAFIKAVSFSPDGKSILSGSGDQTIRQWSVSSGNMVGAPWTGHTATVRSIVYSPDGSAIVSGAEDRTIRFWDANSGSSTSPLEGHSGWVMCVAFSPDGESVASCSNDGTTRLWDARRIDGESDIGPVDSDGWIRTSQGELLLWIPLAFRGRLKSHSVWSVPYLNETDVLEIDFSGFAHGNDWTKTVKL